MLDAVSNQKFDPIIPIYLSCLLFGQSPMMRSPKNVLLKDKETVSAHAAGGLVP